MNRLIAMNRKDILSVNERFGHLMRKPTATTTAPPKSQEGPPTRDRKLQMAKNLGVKLFVAPPPPASNPAKKPDHPPKPQNIHQLTQQHKAQNHHPLTKVHSHHQLNQLSHQPIKQREESPGDRKAAANRSKGDAQAPSQQEKGSKESSSNSSSPSRSHKNSNSSVVVAQPGASQLRMVGQHVIIASHGENGSSNGGRKSSTDDHHSHHPPKSPGRLFTGRRKKVSAASDFAEQVKGEKSSSRFRLKFSFGKSKESKSSSKRPQAKTRQAPNAAPPKHQLSPPREPAPPPPRELTPPPTPDSKDSPYQRRTRPTKGDDNVRPPSPKMPPPGPATYPQFQTYTNIGSFSEANGGDSSALGDSSVEEYLVPVKNQKPDESISSRKEPVEKARPPSPKMPPPGPASYPHLQPVNTQSSTHSFSSNSMALKNLSKSLDSVFDDYVTKTPANSKTQAHSELKPPPKTEDRPPSPKAPPPGPMSYPKLQPLSLESTASPASAVANSSAAGTSSMSLDSILEEFSKMSTGQMGLSMNFF